MRVVALVAVLGLALAGSAGARPAAAPTCTTVSPATVQAALGGSMQATPGTSNSKISGLSYLGCTYSATANISFISPDTSSAFASLLAMLKKATKVSTVTGIGTSAFSGTGSNTSSTCVPGGKCTQKTVTTQNLWVYVAGKAVFEISASGVTLGREESLAKTMVKLV